LYQGERHCPIPGPLWDYVVYDKDIDSYNCNRYWIKAPLNRFITSAQNNIRVRRDGFIGFMNHPRGNPMVQLVGDTANVSRVDMCNWFYDLHFNHVLRFVKQPPAKGFSVTARFRILNFDAAHTRPILEHAQLPAYPEIERQAKAFPRYAEHGLNSFEHSVTLDQGDHSRIWRPFHDHPVYPSFGLTDIRLFSDGMRHDLLPDTPALSRKRAATNPQARCIWDLTMGRSGTSSLKVVTTADAAAGWSLPVFEAPEALPGKRYRLSVWIKTEGLQGRGAALGCFPEAYKSPWTLRERAKKREPIPLLAEPRIRGTTDWRKVELVTPPIPNPRYSGCFEYDLRKCALQPVLWHDGRGTTWFDDFLLEPMDPQ